MSQTHTVAKGETLSSIARHYGKTPGELAEINALPNPDKLKTGQLLYLSKEEANAVQVLLLDALRYPIEGLTCHLKFDDKVIVAKTDARGMLPKIITANIASAVEVWVENKASALKKIGSTVSGLGHQWFTLISPGIKLMAELAVHDEGQAQKKITPANSAQKLHHGKAEGQAIQPGHPVKKRKSQAHNTEVLEMEVPQGLIDLFKHYRDEPVTEKSWQDEADTLLCDPKVLKAIHHVESSGSGFSQMQLKDGTRLPKILFERHLFHRLTCGNGPLPNSKKHKRHGIGVPGCQSPHDQDPDICWPSGYILSRKKLGEENARMPDGVVEQSDLYGNERANYFKLLKAYRLNPEAALKACSWGAFQILGMNYEVAGKYKNVELFVSDICSSERMQLQILRQFIDLNPALRRAVQDKDWDKIALHYNGPKYAENHYQIKLKEAYEKL
ncbi:LysM peptidoglycan-binding domain-containing protein [Methylovorus sp. SPW-M1]